MLRIRVAAAAVIVNPSNEVLLVRRGTAARAFSGYWDCPAGEVEFGESLIDAAKREAREETGLTIEIVSSLGEFEEYLPAEEQHWVSVAFVCRPLTSELAIRENENIEEVRWHKFSELPSRITPIAEVTLLALGERPQRPVA